MADTATGSLSPALDSLLRQHARRQCLPKKGQLFLRGSRPDALFCLLSGKVRLSVTGASGREALLNVVPPGHWFGEASVFSGEARAHDAFAEEDSELLVVPAKVLHRLVHDQPAFLLEFLRLMGIRYKLTLERMDDSVLQPLPTRLALKLLALANTAEAEDTSLTGCQLRVSQESLAQILGVSRQSINKLLKQWEHAGIIAVRYRTIDLLAPERLTRQIH
ncbi:Crp/Fnr family transcriptional regulator [Haliea salexigens]|uniref:Crp/Fnr family transcriptional regulator n=1 Tax=Haliea salexigens TaxID=287487 RepID=UPI00041ABD30|nr:Crp/Fnr family transcriptional regulator [Haliea salexigens]|tara:strand:- start:102 stop:761 length:660 start_codon:yes stop_codon:yes gene_type:complete